MHIPNHRPNSNTSIDASSLAPPFNIEAEQYVLGAILYNNEINERFASYLTADHFYDPLHGEIYAAIQTAIISNQVASPVTLRSTFANHDPIRPDLQVWQYIGKLATMHCGPREATGYAQTIADLGARRSLAAVAYDIALEASSPEVGVTARNIIERAEQSLYQIAETGREDKPVTSLADAAEAAAQWANDAYQAGTGFFGLRTGITDLDRKLGGIQSGNLIIVAGRPGMGKTALGVNNIGLYVADTYTKGTGSDGAAVLVFSMEMSARELGMRLVAARSGISAEKLRRGSATESQIGLVVQAAGEMVEVPMFIDETGGLTLAQLSTRARRIKRKRGIGLIIIDYLQLMAGTSKRGDNRTQELTQITMGLKALAKELSVPIIALSQLSRGVENRADKRPQLADLRESGSIEQDADVVMFVYRPEYYLEREEPPPEEYDKHHEWQAKMEGAAGKAEIVIGKNRNGTTGVIAVAFDGAMTRFGDLAKGDIAHAR